MKLQGLAWTLLLGALVAPHHLVTAAAQTRGQAVALAMVIDINQATAEDFAKLPGIGPKLAQRIVAYREKHGPFRRVEDLLVMRGIGHKKWKAIRPYVKVGRGAGKNSRSRVESQ